MALDISLHYFDDIFLNFGLRYDTIVLFTTLLLNEATIILDRKFWLNPVYYQNNIKG